MEKKAVPKKKERTEWDETTGGGEERARVVRRRSGGSGETAREPVESRRGIGISGETTHSSIQPLYFLDLMSVLLRPTCYRRIDKRSKTGKEKEKREDPILQSIHLVYIVLGV